MSSHGGEFRRTLLKHSTLIVLFLLLFALSAVPAIAQRISCANSRAVPEPAALIRDCEVLVNDVELPLFGPPHQRGHYVPAGLAELHHRELEDGSDGDGVDDAADNTPDRFGFSIAFVGCRCRRSTNLAHARRT